MYYCRNFGFSLSFSLSYVVIRNFPRLPIKMEIIFIRSQSPNREIEIMLFWFLYKLNYNKQNELF